MSEELCPKDHAEAVALFRAQVIGPLFARELSRGELAAGTGSMKSLRIPFRRASCEPATTFSSSLDRRIAAP